MKKKLFFLCLFIYAQNYIQAKNYYFSEANGDDSRTAAQASNPSTPWKTLSKLNAIFSTLQAGDSVLFNRGETFTGNIKVQKSGAAGKPIVFSCYGNKASSLPVISGLSTLGNWQKEGTNIYSCSFSNPSGIINTLLINNNPVAMGRYPNNDAANQGYLTFESHNGTSQITDNQLTGATNWKNAELVLRTCRYVIDRNLITQHSGTTITFVPSTNYNPIDNFGYFIQNHLATLDKFGEWFFDKNANKLYMFFGTITPTKYNIRAGYYDILVDIASQSNITFSNLTFSGANTDAFKLNKVQNIQILNCNILYPGTNGITSTNNTGIKVDNCTITGANNTALSFYSRNDNTILTNNTIKNSGTLNGMGKSGTSTSMAISIYGNNNNVGYNKIDSTGYIGISFYGNDVTIKNNYINYFNLLKDDGGGIYAWIGKDENKVWSNRRIEGNIILNGIGAGAGTNAPNEQATEGIYMDDNSSEVDIINNTISNCKNTGIFIHNNHNMNIRGNTAYNNQKTQIWVKHDEICPDCPSTGIISKDNIWFSKTVDQLTAYYRSFKDEISQFGSFDSNYYCRPFKESQVIQSEYKISSKTYKAFHDLKDWSATFKQDANSRKTPVAVPNYSIVNFIGSNLYSNGTFPANVKGTSVYTGNGSATATWDNNTTKKLDGGCLRYTYTSSSSGIAILYVNVGNVKAGKNYILRYSSLGTKDDKNITNYLMQTSSPNTVLSDKKSVSINTARIENELLFTPSKTESNASIIFEINESVGTVYLDNIQFQEVEVVNSTPDDYIRFEYNASKTSKTISLGSAVYKDVKNKSYTGNITLAPFTSIILIKVYVPTAIITTPSLSNDFNIYPNPTQGVFNLTGDFIQGEEIVVELYNQLGAVAYSQRLVAGDVNGINLTDRNITPGIYVVTVTNKDGQRSSKKLIVTE